MGVVWGGGDDVYTDSAGRECLTAERGVMLREYRGSTERGRWLTKTSIQQEGSVSQQRGV